MTEEEWDNLRVGQMVHVGWGPHRGNVGAVNYINRIGERVGLIVGPTSIVVSAYDLIVLESDEGD